MALVSATPVVVPSEARAAAVITFDDSTDNVTVDVGTTGLFKTQLGEVAAAFGTVPRAGLTAGTNSVVLTEGPNGPASDVITATVTFVGLFTADLRIDFVSDSDPGPPAVPAGAFAIPERTDGSPQDIPLPNIAGVYSVKVINDAERGQAAPEPTSASMFGLGLLALFGLSRSGTDTR
jgi:hypothetical protein